MLTLPTTPWPPVACTRAHSREQRVTQHGEQRAERPPPLPFRAFPAGRPGLAFMSFSRS